MSATFVNVRSRFLDPDNYPVKGTITFVLSDTVQDPTANLEWVPQRVRVEIDGNGYIYRPLLATNSPGLVPSNVTYTVTEDIDGAPDRTYSIPVPYDSPLGELWLADVAPAIPGPALYQYALESELTQHVNSMHTGHVGDETPTGVGYVPAIGTNTQASRQDHAHAGAIAISITDSRFAYLPDGPAVGDDFTDNHDAIQAACTLVGSLGGGIVYFPPGIFRTTASITVPTGVWLEGAGMYVSAVKYTGGAGDCFVGATLAGVGIRDLEIIVTTANAAINHVHYTDVVYGEFANIILSGGTMASGTNKLTGILIDNTAGGHTPPLGSLQFRNILGVTEPTDSGNVTNGGCGIHVKGRATAGDGYSHVTFEGWGNLEHYAFGIKLEYVTYGHIGTGWQMRGNTDTEIALVACTEVTVDQPELAPAPTTGKGLTLDASCANCTVDVIVNTSSGAPATIISDLGTGTRYPGVGGPGGNRYLRAARKNHSATDYTPSAATWTRIAFDGALDCAFHGRAGDWVTVELSALISNENETLYLDAQAVDSGNTWGLDTTTDNAKSGVLAWAGQASIFSYPSGSVTRQLTAADCVLGVCTVRLIGRTIGGTTKTIYGTTNARIAFSAVNHGQ